MTALPVTSEAVPAVVGTLIVGTPGTRSTSTPIQSSALPPLVTTQAAIWEVSMALPPPTPSTTAGLAWRMASAQASTLVVGGSGSTSSHTLASIPARANSSVTRSTTPASTSPLSVTTNTWPSPIRRTCSGNSSRQPRPKTTVGVVRYVQRSSKIGHTVNLQWRSAGHYVGKRPYHALDHSTCRIRQ